MTFFECTPCPACSLPPIPVRLGDPRVEELLRTGVAPHTVWAAERPADLPSAAECAVPTHCAGPATPGGAA